ncbi:hypothetical protein LINPERHAP1_LOCUS37811 [Linum perenne]
MRVKVVVNVFRVVDYDLELATGIGRECRYGIGQ